MQAIAYDNRSGEKVEVLSGPSPKAIFTWAQYAYGHCLGSIVGRDGSVLGWRFARCAEPGVCPRVDIVDIQIRGDK